MDPKWSQNGKKGVQPHKMIPRWLPGPIPYEGLVDFELFLDPFGAPKSTQNATLAENGVTGNGVLSIFLLFLFYLIYLRDFSPIFDRKSMFPPLFFQCLLAFFAN